MATKTRLALGAGILFFVVGTGVAAYLGTRRGPSTPVVARVPAYYAVAVIDTGTSGAVAFEQGRLERRMVEPASRSATAVADPSQIATGVAAAPIPAGTAVTVEMFPAPQTRIGTVVIPPGKRALAVRLEAVPGIAGFAGAGDLIDVYGVFEGADKATSRVQLVLQGVEVLNVNGAGLPAVQGQADGALVYLVAVTPTDAERVIFISEFDRLYFDLVARGEAPVVTPGAGLAEAQKGV